MDDVANALNIDLRLEFGLVAAATGNRALDPGHACPNRCH